MPIYSRQEAIAERTRRGWTVADLAEHTEISADFITDFERGLRWLPPAYAQRVGAALRESHSLAESRG